MAAAYESDIIPVGGSILPKGFVSSDDIPSSSGSSSAANGTNSNKAGGLRQTNVEVEMQGAVQTIDRGGGGDDIPSAGGKSGPKTKGNGSSLASELRVSAWDGSGMETDEVPCITRWMCCTNDDDEDTGCCSCCGAGGTGCKCWEED